ncbi:unnamed protein product, partial [Rotaria sp. Silwood1]
TLEANSRWTIDIVNENDLVDLLPLLRAWSTLHGGRLAVMNDLYVDENYRGQDIADLFIAEYARRGREHSALCLTWHTSVDNKRAQAVYERNGGVKSTRWLDYSKPR